jgi:hypothetical protein
MTGYKWEKMDRLTALRLVLICAVILLFLSIGRLATSAQEATPTDPPLTRTMQCGGLELHLEEFDVKTWSICEHGTLYVLGYCDGYQSFDLSGSSTESAEIYYEWYCGDMPGYVTKASCLQFPGALHFRLIAKDNTTLEELNCPS